MSLNGLDAPAIAEAAQLLQSNHSAWFLLRYATRDEIELLSSGTDGVAGVHASIAGYLEKSPLYGLIGGNGARVLLKYVPPGTSRLLQARVKVHLEELEEYFAHEGELSITSADELTAEALANATGGALASPPSDPAPASSAGSAAAAAATAAAAAAAAIVAPTTGATSDPIATPPTDDKPLPPPPESVEPNPQEIQPTIAVSRTAQLLADVRAGKLESHEVLAALKITPQHVEPVPDYAAPVPDYAAPIFPVRTDSLPGESSATAPVRSSVDEANYHYPSPRLSTGSNNEPLYKPKKKLAPRPVLVTEPNSPGIASLPSNISIPIRSPTFQPPASPIRPTSSQTAHVPFRTGESGMFPLVQAPASVVPSSHVEPSRPKSRAGSVVTLPASYGTKQTSTKIPRSPKDIPQEKLRLMKALELRRKQQAKERASNEASSAEPSPQPASTMTSPAIAGEANGAEKENNGNGPKNNDSQAGLGIELENAQQGESKQLNLAAAENASRNDDSAVGTVSTAPAEALVTETTQPSTNGAQRSPSNRISNIIDVPPVVPEEGITATAPPTDSHLPPTSETLQRKGEDISGREEKEQRQETATAATSEPAQPPANADAISDATKDLAAPVTTLLEEAPASSIPAQSLAQDFATGEKQPISTAQGSDTDARDDSSETTPTATKPTELIGNAAPAQVDHSGPEAAPLHSKHISISTSLSGASFLDELDTSTVEEAQPMTMVKSPVTPTYSKSFESEIAKQTVPEVPEIPSNIVQPTTEVEPQVKHADTKTMDTAIVSSLESIEKVQATEEETMPMDPVSDTEALRPSITQESAVTSPSASDALSTPIEEREAALGASPASTARGESPATKKHPTINPPHIWGGPLRAASNPTGPPSRHYSPSPDLQRLNRSASIASNNSNAMMRPDSPSGFKKPSVGSRIADRIKALEKSSGGPSSGSTTFITPASVSVTSRKSSFNTPPGSSGGEASRKAPYPTPSPSPGSNIFTRRFGSTKAGPPSESARTDNTIRPTILNAGGHGAAGPGASGETQRPTARPTFIRQQSSDSRNSADDNKRGDGSASRDGQSQKRGPLSGPRLSFSGRQSSETQRTGHSRQSSVESTGTNGDKKDSKAKKLMKRVTGAFSPRKDRHAGNGGLSTSPIMEAVEQEPSSAGALRSGGTSRVPGRGNAQSKWNQTVVVGEVNIQFPDTLLDGDGYIVLLPSASDRSSRVASKKFHLSEFHPPYIPDQEREELPYSIILDFMDSSTLQCACQNTTDQTNVLAALTTVHSAFAHQGQR